MTLRENGFNFENMNYEICYLWAIGNENSIE